MLMISDIDRTIAKLTKEQKNFLRLKLEWSERAEKSEANLLGLTWENNYYYYISEQEVIENNMNFIQELFNGVYLNAFFSTGRSEKFRRETEEWLRPYGFNQRVLMRKENDFRNPHEVKKDNLNKLKDIYGGKNYLVFEDDPDCQKMYKEEDCFLIYPPGGF